MLLVELLGMDSIHRHQKGTKTLNDIHKINPFKDEYSLVALDCYCGIEIEVENLKQQLPLSPEVWRAKGDNSLRNGGLEYISYPVAGRDILRSLELFYRLLPDDALFSPRTSIHIHVNALDLELEKIECFVMLYLLFEKVLYRFIGKDRNQNIFCVPIQDTFRVGQLIADIHKCLTMRIPIENAERRYAGLNLASLFTFGTFEFRQLNGTRRLDLIVAWINMLLCIKEYTKTVALNELKDHINILNTTSDYRQFLFSVFGNISKYFDFALVDQDMERGVYAVKHSIITRNFQDFVKKSFSDATPAALFMKNQFSNKIPIGAVEPVFNRAISPFRLADAIVFQNDEGN